jgi:hypothetical protein
MPTHSCTLEEKYEDCKSVVFAKYTAKNYCII